MVSQWSHGLRCMEIVPGKRTILSIALCFPYVLLPHSIGLRSDKVGFS